MASPFETAKINLDYLPYACEFDPQDANRLVVGGGGGANRSGVANKITVIDASAKDELRISGEADLSRNEDSVMTLAIGPKKGRTSHVYAGINSSPADVEKGKNEHFRVFGVEQSKARASAGTGTSTVTVAELARTALFEHNEIDKDAYQRVLRLSAPYGDKPQLGAVATGLAKESQIALFEVSPTSAAAPKVRGRLDITKEPMDIDVIQTGEDEFQVAYCDDRELFLIKITKTQVDGPHLVYTIQEDGTGAWPTFRSIRFLSPDFIMAGTNIPQRAGSLLLGIRLPTKAGEVGRLSASAKLPRAVTQITTIAARNLSPPSTPGGKIGNAQFLVAAVGQDRSISLFTLEHKVYSTIDLLVDFDFLTTLKEVHPLQITNVALSVFVPPKTTARPQYVKLASISMKNTVVVHSILLKKFTDKDAPIRKGGPPRPQRYAVALQPRRLTKSRLTVVTFLVLLLAVLVQLSLETAGVSPLRILPSRHAVANAPNEFLTSLIGDVHALQGDPIVIREDVVSPTHIEEDPVPRFQAAVHDEEVYGPAVSWEDLAPQQKKLWKEKLSKAGHWTQNMGESVFKGILFGEIAGAVGRAVGG
ncbi:Putative WD40/YVTN repeat-like-containing domain superfamily [Colletotrichum destructivum]|uniref:Guanine nucleotide-exchange factor SEC12 n=1 Tax=Colletotrichum destructivum TaxID=34406 RepID=A0AAX4HZZ8_9PEZI|nr:Putative WD40/YVTN repeat-like-containing domain superfamily [Colletotrichum destructivum]